MTVPAIGDPVRVHKNLHRGDWSVTVKGKVVAHVAAITLKNVTFKIRESARQRVIAKRCREVHAWAQGVVSDNSCDSAPHASAISYNPYRAASFTVCATGAPVEWCEQVEFCADGRVIAKGQTR